MNMAQTHTNAFSAFHDFTYMEQDVAREDMPICKDVSNQLKIQ